MVKKTGKYAIGCDIGGTFTDFVILNKEKNEVYIGKCLTTPQNPADAVIDGIQAIPNISSDFLRKTQTFIHGTTLVINAIIEKKGVRTGLITTNGFRDIIEIGTEMKYDIFDLNLDFPPPIVDRYLRKEVDERIYSDGRVLKNIDKIEAENVVSELLNQNVKSVAISLLHSYANNEHEKIIQKIINQMDPKVSVTISSDLLPEIKEYERTSTTVLNAYVKPIVEKYLDEIFSRLQLLGYKQEVFIMLSSGGITSLETAKNYPIRIVESGPVAGAMAAAYFGKIYDINKILSFDMGGTTAKSCIIKNGRIDKVSTYEVGRVHRFKKGSGYPVQVPVIDMLEIGAGGGSIAKVSKLGLLQVGPESAGADPGPACYSLGGKNPTVTDADLILGYLDPKYFLGGEIKLNYLKAEKAIEHIIAKPLDVSIHDAAWGVHDLINETMASAARIHTTEKGEDISKQTMIAFGGAGPVHAYGLAKKLGIEKIIIPINSGVCSAFGFFVSPFSYDLVKTFKTSLKRADLVNIEKEFEALEKQGKLILKAAGKSSSIKSIRSIDCRYIGQGFEITCTLPDKAFTNFSKKEIIKLFEDNYSRIYGRVYLGIGIEILNIRVEMKIEEPIFLQPKKWPKTLKSNTKTIKGERKAFSQTEHSFINFPIYDRYKLFHGAKFKGPAIIEERESTTIVDTDCEVFIDDICSLIIDIIY